MSDVFITIEDDGSQWLPYQTSGPNAGLPPGVVRVGTFSIPHELIEKGEPTVFAVMSQVMVLRCEHQWTRACFVYEAYSPNFRPVELGVIPPEYRIIMHKDENGRVDRFYFEEVKAPYLKIEDASWTPEQAEKMNKYLDDVAGNILKMHNGGS